MEKSITKKGRSWIHRSTKKITRTITIEDRVEDVVEKGTTLVSRKVTKQVLPWKKELPDDHATGVPLFRYTTLGGCAVEEYVQAVEGTTARVALRFSENKEPVRQSLWGLS